MNLKINHRKGIANLKYFNDFELDLKFDSVASTFGFKFYFDPQNQDHREMACVSHFHDVIVEHNGETLITGRILTQVFNDGPEKELSEIGGYSMPGVLEDCEIPTSLYPLQSDGRTLKEITERLIAKFKLKLKVDEIARRDSGAGISIKQKADKKIKKSTAAAAQNVKSYLTELAAQRHVILSHDEKGNLLFTEAKTDNKPLFHLEPPMMVGTKMSMAFNGQPIHSEITILKQADADGGNATEHTIKNPYCPVAYVVRPKVVEMTSGDDITVEQFAKQQLAAELKNIVLTIETDRWEIDGKIIRPNNTITVKNPNLFLFKKTKWFIESVKYRGDNEKTIATLTCVPPEVYNMKTPQNIFVDPHNDFPRL